MSSDFNEEYHFTDLKELHEAIYKCKKCNRLGKKVERVQTPWNNKLGRRKKEKWAMWVGQAPPDPKGGRREKMLNRKQTKLAPQSSRKRTKKVRKGDTWKIFKGWLAEGNMPEEYIEDQVYKTALIKCYPGKKKDKGDRPPRAAEIRNCGNFLNEQIRLINPTVILPMGRLPVGWFFRGRKLEDVVGKRMVWNGRTVVCFPHASRVNRWLNKVENKALKEKAVKIVIQEWRKNHKAEEN